MFRITTACLAFALAASAMSPAERRQYLEKLQQILPSVPSFNAWLEKTAELPPDFHAFPTFTTLPAPLHFLDGRPVRNPQDWRARRTEIRTLFEKYDLGSF